MQEIKAAKSRFERIPLAEVIKRVLPEEIAPKTRSHSKARAKNVVKTGSQKVYPYSVSTPEVRVEE